jgi:hypothetical protein
MNYSCICDLAVVSPQFGRVTAVRATFSIPGARTLHVYCYELQCVEIRHGLMLASHVPGNLK